MEREDFERLLDKTINFLIDSGELKPEEIEKYKQDAEKVWDYIEGNQDNLADGSKYRATGTTHDGFEYSNQEIANDPELLKEYYDYIDDVIDKDYNMRVLIQSVRSVRASGEVSESLPPFTSYPTPEIDFVSFTGVEPREIIERLERLRKITDENPEKNVLYVPEDLYNPDSLKDFKEGAQFDIDPSEMKAIEDFMIKEGSKQRAAYKEREEQRMDEVNRSGNLEDDNSAVQDEEIENKKEVLQELGVPVNENLMLIGINESYRSEGGPEGIVEISTEYTLNEETGRYDYTGTITQNGKEIPMNSGSISEMEMIQKIEDYLKDPDSDLDPIKRQQGLEALEVVKEAALKRSSGGMEQATSEFIDYQKEQNFAAIGTEESATHNFDELSAEFIREKSSEMEFV